MSASSSANSRMIVMGLFLVMAVGCVVAVHMHPEMVDSVKNWFSETVNLPHM